MYTLTTLCKGEATGRGEFECLYSALSEGAEALCGSGLECDEYEVRKGDLLLAFGYAEHVAKKEAA